MVDNARKDAQRLVDKAIHQYKQAKKFYNDCLTVGSIMDQIKRGAETAASIPEADRTPAQKAIIKTLNDCLYFSDRDYDYQEDWDDSNPGRLY